MWLDLAAIYTGIIRLEMEPGIKIAVPPAQKALYGPGAASSAPSSAPARPHDAMK